MMPAVLAALAVGTWIGEFAFLDTRDAITDKQRTFVGLAAGNDTLRIGCDADFATNRVVVQLVTDEFLGSYGLLNGLHPLTYRFNSTPPVTFDWHIRDRTALISERKPVAAFLRSMANSSKVVMRLRRQSGEEIDKEFKFREASAAINRVVERCNDMKIKTLLNS